MCEKCVCMLSCCVMHLILNYDAVGVQLSRISLNEVSVGSVMCVNVFVFLVVFAIHLILNCDVIGI